jgi:CubicO group peptidase (beta-lactamase class C family)
VTNSLSPSRLTTSSLPRSTPSAQGVDARGILAFLDAAEAAGIDHHSLMLVKNGNVVAEGWWAPYGPDRVHLLYSLSKSFTATAIGIAIGEGRLSLDDLVTSFFPDQLPAEISPHLAAMRVRHLLAMASGHADDTITKIFTGGPDLIANFLAIPPDAEPGTLFCYNQGCTMTLSAIISKLTGEKLVDYLRPRLFDPLGIKQATWLELPGGINQGFSGLHAVTESIAKLGQLHLQGGKWDGRQLVPEAFVAEARQYHVDNSPASENPDWQQGYGFQFWMCRHDAFRGDGAFGQFLVIVPAADALIVVTAQEGDMQRQADLFWEHLLPALSSGAEPDAGADGRLTERLATLTTPTLVANGASPPEPVTFASVGEPASRFEDLTAVRVEPAPDGCRLVLVRGADECAVDVRAGEWIEGAVPDAGQLLPPVMVTGGWTDEATFAADIVFVTAPHRLQVRGVVGESPTVETSWMLPPL